MLQVRELGDDEPWVARLRYAYADALLVVGRAEEAREWFARSAEIDLDAQTDAAERLLELDGVVLDDGDDDDGDDDDGDDDGADHRDPVAPAADADEQVMADDGQQAATGLP
jgi:hypothetical protein